MSLISHNDLDLDLDLIYKSHPNFNRNIQQTRSIITLPPDILKKIIDNIKDTENYKNLRALCRAFYFICENMIVFDSYGNKIKEIFISNHKVYKIEKYSTLLFYLSNHSKYFKKSSCLIKNNSKHGAEIEYDHRGIILKRTPYKFGKKNGFQDEYLDSRLIKRTGYIDGHIHGKRIYYFNNYSIRIEWDYLINILLKYKKYIKNVIVIDASFKGNTLSGKTFIYYEFDEHDIHINNIKHILNFKQSELHGNCVINQFDRILKINYNNGLLEGPQSVFNIDNKLRFIGNYHSGKLNGKYALYNNYKQVEEGFIINGLYDKYITILKPNELSKITYPIMKGLIHGTYIERINFLEIKISYKYGFFDGQLYFTDITNGEVVKLIIYNRNNFHYSKMRFGIEYITLVKDYGKYTLTIYDIKNEKETGKRRAIKLTNFF